MASLASHLLSQHGSRLHSVLLHQLTRNTVLKQQCRCPLKNTRWSSTRVYSTHYKNIMPQFLLYDSTCSFRNHTGSYAFHRTKPLLGVRGVQTGPNAGSKRLRTATIYVCALGVFMVGMTYAGVPLYRMFCRATGTGGQAIRGHDETKVESMQAVEDRVIKVRFNADTHSSMQWNFRPQQTEVRVLPGETALAFYTAMNPTDKPIIGISTYNVVPFDAGQYFNKIQCFCFEEQRLNPHEKVDMPVFFYIDPEFAEDPKLEGVDMITLSYTFFEAKDGMEIPLPGYMQNYSSSRQPQPQ